MKIPTILFLYSSENSPNEMPFTGAAIQDQSYRAFYTRAEQRGIRVVRAALEWFRDGAWSQYWAFENNQWVKHEESILPDIVIDKSTFDSTQYKQHQIIQRYCTLLNPWEIKTITSDKLITAIAFADFMPQTFVVQTTEELQDAIARVKTAEVVVKPQYGFGGTGVQILPPAEAALLEITEPHVVQSCIDTSGGITGIVEGYHDLRVVLMGNEPVFSYVRTPAPGSKLCNLTQGGAPIIVPVAEIPPAAIEVIQAAQKRFGVFAQSLYCVDLLFDENQKPWIVELNDSPGIYYPDGAEDLQELAIDSYLNYCSLLLKQ